MLPIIFVTNQQDVDEYIDTLRAQQNIHVSHVFHVRPEKGFLVEHAHAVRSYLSQAHKAQPHIVVLHNFGTSQPVSQNALLKTLEEDSKGVLFVMVVTDESQVLATIRSRSQIAYDKNQSLQIRDLQQFNIQLESLTLPQWLSMSAKSPKADAEPIIDAIIHDIRNNMLLDGEGRIQYVESLRSLMVLRKRLRENNLYYEYALDSAGYILHKAGLIASD